MKARFLALIIFSGITLHIAQAQVVMQPANPNEACAEAWAKYHKGDVLWNTGWGLFGGGMIAGALGWTLFPIFSTALPPDAPQEQKNRKTAAIASTLTVATLGSAAFLASIPCLAVGQVRRKTAIKNYEEWNCESYLSCEQINSYYHNADVMWKTGWGLFGAGMGMFTFGMLCIVPNVFPPAPGPDPYALEKSGFAILGVGCGAVIASVPCICVGHVRRKASQGLYNDKCADQAPLTFSIQSSSNGIGLAMQF